MDIKRLRIHVAAALMLAVLSSARAETTISAPGADELVLGIPRVTEPHTHDLDGILDRGVLRVLTTYSPSNFFIIDGRPQGFEYQLLRDFARILEQRMEDRTIPFIVQFIPLLPEELIPALLQGRGDIVANDMHIEGMEDKEAVFSAPYLGGIKACLVSHRSVEPLTSMRDLPGRKVIVADHHGYRKEVSRLNHDLAMQGLAHMRIEVADPGLTVEDILELVNAGVYGLTVVDSHLAQLWARAFPDLRVHEDLALGNSREVGWLVRSGNPELKRSLDAFISDHKKGTKIGNIYFRKYFQKELCLQGCLTLEHQSRFAGFRDLFQKYGAKFGLDWLLLAAQAFQESGLRQDRVSEDGAVGLMQVMPTLTRDRRIGRFDLQDVEQNVHAGSKYMKHLLDIYFNGEDLEDEERMRLALAAYNAGPSAIHRARLKAADMGLDANRLFGHVERGARLTLGLEPVDYVSRINRLYIAYRLSSQSLARRVRIKERIISRLTGTATPGSRVSSQRVLASDQ